MSSNAVLVIWNSLPFLLVGLFPQGQLGGLALTVILSVVIGIASLAFGSILGLVAALAPSGMRWLAGGLMVVIRGMPALAFLFWIYFLLPRLLGFDLAPLYSACIALTAYHGSYIAADIRGGVRSVPAGQWEAARAFGLRTLPTLVLIILPQAFRAVLPSLINRIVNLVIYTSVISILGVLEFTRAAMIVNNRELLYPQYIFAFVGLVYFVICYVISMTGKMLERRWAWSPAYNTRSTRSSTP